MNTTSLKPRAKTNVGLWIDHRKAIVVMLTPQGEKTIEILSHVEKHPSRDEGDGVAADHESNNILADDRHQVKYTQELHRYYMKIAIVIHEADSILIFGPSEAKGELKKHLEAHAHDQKKITVETSDKMTDRQISAKVHDHFHR